MKKLYLGKKEGFHSPFTCQNVPEHGALVGFPVREAAEQADQRD
jgi:hypothetical protein